jgi:hypothetical protein
LAREIRDEITAEFCGWRFGEVFRPAPRLRVVDITPILG